MTSQFLTNEQIILAARRNLPQYAWDYLVGGVESETTLRRNRSALDRVAFRPRVLRDVSRVDPSATLLGCRLPIPVIFAPIGSMQHLAPDGAISFAKAAARCQTVMSMSIMTPPSIEEVAAAADGPKILQIYVQGDLAWARDLFRRAHDAGYFALCLTVDTPYHSRRDRSLYNPAPARARPAGMRAAGGSHNYGAAVTWETMDALREAWGGKFIVKGLTTADDAALAVEHGADAVWLSNHGGRQLDATYGALDALPAVVEAVAGRAEVIFDSGIMRGTDVLKAIALGADAVAIGKLQGWGMGAAGIDGLVRVMEILETEIITAMGLLGVSCLDQVTPRYVTAAEPVTPPHEMSAFPNLVGGRLL
jgi:isopentenyl diphosphate isomerase/L-lactate dehydrogenase-like FMN-dependent dehydrogenase